jgi:hypothetical protein
VIHADAQDTDPGLRREWCNLPPGASMVLTHLLLRCMRLMRQITDHGRHRPTGIRLEAITLPQEHRARHGHWQ